MIPATSFHIGKQVWQPRRCAIRVRPLKVETPSAQRHDCDKTMPGPTKGSRPMRDTFVRKGGCES
jgi:hypothetical protein